MGGLDAELTLLACCILKNDLIDKAVLANIKPTWFTKNPHRLLWTGMVETRLNDGQDIDLTWATDYMVQKTGRPLIPLTNACVDVLSLSEFDSALEILQRRHLQQEIGNHLTRAQVQLTHDDPMVVVDRLCQNLSSLRESVDSPKMDVRGEIERAISEGIKYSWGYPQLDLATRGVGPYLYIVAGDSGHLKTTFVLNLTYNLIHSSIPVHFFSGEMSPALIIEKLAIMKSGLNTRDVISEEDRPRFLNCVDKIQSFPLTIINSVSLPRIRIEARRGKSKVYVIDYLNLMQSDLGGATREREVSRVVEELARLRSEYRKCIIAIAAVNRGEREKNLAPTLRNLKESSSIEYGADFVLFTYYKWRTQIWSQENLNQVEKRILRTHLAKNRITGIEQRIDFEYCPESLRIEEKERKWWEE